MEPNMEALRQLRRVVESSPDNNLFDMSYVSEETECGTSHCAYGWAREDPWFKENTKITSTYFSESPGVFGLSEENILKIFYPSSMGRSVRGPKAKVRVIANIDRILSGEIPIDYSEIDDVTPQGR